ncbi:hypothetical protein [Microlunatus speluncae]|uniref:hypothetical protein n=1 Tax=Microlunatus speluncae TaxID=2594267 RepID=UPI0012663293|nr:hypothetical protein [Microlunatus speluncae]
MFLPLSLSKGRLFRSLSLSKGRLFRSLSLSKGSQVIIWRRIRPEIGLALRQAQGTEQALSIMNDMQTHPEPGPVDGRAGSRRGAWLRVRQQAFDTGRSRSVIQRYVPDHRQASDYSAMISRRRRLS